MSMTSNFDSAMTTLTDVLYETYGDLLDSVFSFFYAVNDIAENTMLNVGIVLAGKPTQEMKNTAAQQIQFAKETCDSNFAVSYFTQVAYRDFREELEYNTVYWANGRKVESNAQKIAVGTPIIWQDETDEELPM